MSLHSIGYLFREGLKSLWKNRTMSIASIGVLIACLLMTGVAALLTLNISATMQSVEGNNVITVYLSSDVPALTAVRIGEEIRQIDNIAECTFVPKDTALSGVMQDIDGGGTLFDSFTGDNNPLPDSYEISLADLSIYDETVSQITAIEGVESVSNYSHVAETLSSLDRVVRYGSVGIVAVLAVVSLFIISNTVKVTIFSRRMEINIMKSVGATNGLRPRALHCGRHRHRHHLRPGVLHNPLLRLRQLGEGGHQPGPLPHHSEYPALCVYPLWRLHYRWHVLWPAGRHYFHWQISEEAGRKRHCLKWAAHSRPPNRIHSYKAAARGAAFFSDSQGLRVLTH